MKALWARFEYRWQKHAILEGEEPDDDWEGLGVFGVIWMGFCFLSLFAFLSAFVVAPLTEEF